MEEQRVAIKFFVKASKSAMETIELFNKAYGSSAISRAIVYRWYARFWDGREDMKDDARSGHPSIARSGHPSIARSGHPSTARTDENMESVVCWQKTVVPLSKWLLIVWILVRRQFAGL